MLSQKFFDRLLVLLAASGAVGQGQRSKSQLEQPVSHGALVVVLAFRLRQGQYPYLPIIKTEPAVDFRRAFLQGLVIGKEYPGGA